MKDNYIHLIRNSPYGQPHIISMHKVELTETISKLLSIKSNLVQDLSNSKGQVVSLVGIDDAIVLLGRIME